VRCWLSPLPLPNGMPVYKSCALRVLVDSHDPPYESHIDHSYLRGRLMVNGKKVAQSNTNCYNFDDAKRRNRHGPGGFWRILFRRSAKSQLKDKRVVRGTLVIDQLVVEDSNTWRKGLRRIPVTLRNR
jgi:hypothetical protein